MPTLRLIHVMVQPVFMLDDGDGKPLRHIIVTGSDGVERNLTTNHPIAPISAEEWPTFATDRFAREVQAWQEQIDAEHAKTNGNRAQRRARAKR